MEAGRQAAHLAALNILAVARQHLRSLDRVTRIVRLGASVAALGDVRDQPKVAGAAWNRNGLAAQPGMHYANIQAPLGLSSQRLTAAVSNFRGRGSFGAQGLALEAIKDVIAQIRIGILELLVEEVSEIAGPVSQWSTNRRQTHSNS